MAADGPCVYLARCTVRCMEPGNALMWVHSRLHCPAIGTWYIGTWYTVLGADAQYLHGT